jgi:sec-independent protein translocase protein TatC
VFTPPDVISQFMMAVPLWLLYELGIVLASVIVRPVPAEAGQSDYQPPSDEEMNKELDRAEQQSSGQKT